MLKPKNDRRRSMTLDIRIWKDALVNLFALAGRLEGEGQYNLAKLARAAADSLSRKAAYQLDTPTNREKLAAELKETAGVLSIFEVNPKLVAAFTHGAEIMADGKLPLYDVAPNPSVCRTCGDLVMGEPDRNCPTCGAWPGTYQRFHPVYWLNALEPFAALEQLRKTPLEVEQLIAGLSEAELNQRPAEGEWAIRHVLSHMRDAQGVLEFRLGLFMTGENPVLESKAVFSWATNEDDRPPSAFDILETYKTSRTETIRKLELLPLVEWWKTGRHEEFGEVTLRQQVSYFTAHELTHLPQIDKIRRQFFGLG